MRLHHVEIDGDTLYVVADIDGQTVEVMADIQQASDVLHLEALHLDGPGANSLGLSRLRRLAQACMEVADVAELVVEGGRRTTGAAPGRWPDRLRFRRRAR